MSNNDVSDIKRKNFPFKYQAIYRHMDDDGATREHSSIWFNNEDDARAYAKGTHIVRIRKVPLHG